jgi:hypothetical protein
MAAVSESVHGMPQTSSEAISIVNLAGFWG